jgi:predicted nucleic acid-binding protein
LKLRSWDPAITTTVKLPDSLEKSLRQRLASLPLDVADASIVEAAERLGIQHVVSIDQDCDAYRNDKGEALVNLLP